MIIVGMSKFYKEKFNGINKLKFEVVWVVKTENELF